ncbi:MAG: rod shape-determining protein MreD [Prolixibacteraceae bacterium]|nr:rod shape-determining protein MreD [Prolixibacteraceae bacterium]
MVKIWIKYLVLFVVVVLVQVLLLNQIQFSGYLNPYAYVLFILLLRVSTPRNLVLILSFLLGLTIDIFSDTLGLHAAATTALGFFRTPVIELISLREEDQANYPGLKQNGFKWFFLYATILVLIHHFSLFFIDAFTLANFLKILARTLLSSAFSIFVIVLSQYMFFRE